MTLIDPVDQQPPKRRPLIVSIVGPSGAGKSQLAKLTQSVLGDEIATRIPTDDFFVPRPAQLPLAEFLKRPLQYDWDLLRFVLQQPIGTPVETPDADFTGFTRTSNSGGRPFIIRPVMITDAMVRFPGANMLVLLDVPAPVRRERIAARDIRWGAHVLANWEHLEATWDVGRAELPDPDLTLDGTRSLPLNAHALADLIRSHLTKAASAHELA